MQGILGVHLAADGFELQRGADAGDGCGRGRRRIVRVDVAFEDAEELAVLVVRGGHGEPVAGLAAAQSGLDADIVGAARHDLDAAAPAQPGGEGANHGPAALDQRRVSVRDARLLHRHPERPAPTGSHPVDLAGAPDQRRGDRQRGCRAGERGQGGAAPKRSGAPLDHSLEAAGDLGHGRARARRLDEAGADQGANARRCRAWQAGEVGGAGEHLGDSLGHRRRVEGAGPGERLREAAPERPDVAAIVALLTADLLGRHVRGRAHHDAGGLEGGGDLVVGRPTRLQAQPRQPKVQHLGHPLRGEDHVGGLEVAMDHAAGVDRGDGAGDVAADAEPLVDRQR